MAKTIESMLKQSEAVILDPILKFKVSEEAADHNLNLLHQNDFNVTNLYNHQKKSAITYGLEFKMTSILEQLTKIIEDLTN